LFLRDQVALVVAEDEKTAEYAATKIKIDFEDLPV